MGKIFYIADLHFGHANVIRFDNRPYKNVEEMNRALINNWNSVVTNDDTVYILGDFCWSKEPVWINLLDQLKGKKVLIKGNHDLKKMSYSLKNKFEDIKDYKEINDNGTKVILSHYPMPFWNGQFRDSVHLYGHIHNTHQWNMIRSWKKELQQLQDLPGRMYNVGCMMSYMNYYPRTLDEILKGAKND